MKNLSRPDPASERFLRACRREAVDRTPVWFMRQAGRFLPGYRKVRKKATLVEICHDPDLCVEVTLEPVEKLGVDAAILFADILLPLEPMGAPFHFAAGEGPVIEKPVKSPEAVKRLKALDDEAVGEELGYVLEDVKAIREALAGKVPLIGFAGAPFTLAAYLIAGGGGPRELATVRAFLLGEAKAFAQLMEKLTRTTIAYLKAQVAAGVQAVQLFDSWVGCLSPEEYLEHVAPWSKQVFAALKPLGVPRIHFGVDTAMLLVEMREAGGDVMGVDWKVPLDQARRLLGDEVALQGNLDPAALLAPAETALHEARRVLRAARGLPGHVFNVGHGILPDTDPGLVAEVVRLVHSETESTRPR